MTCFVPFLGLVSPDQRVAPGEESVQLAVIEGARVGSEKPLKKHARRPKFGVQVGEKHDKPSGKPGGKSLKFEGGKTLGIEVGGELLFAPPPPVGFGGCRSVFFFLNLETSTYHKRFPLRWWHATRLLSK